MKKAICFLILSLTNLCSAGVADSNLISYYPLNEVNDSNVIFDQQSATKAYLAGTPYYLMACHNSNLVGMYDSNDLYLFDSNDGKAWRLLNGGSSYHEPVYQFRDPSIFRHTNGNYYITYTTNNLGGFDGNQIGIIKSSDLVTWTKVCYVKFPNITTAWAPEWYVDPAGIVHIFVMTNYTIKEMHHTVVGDFNNWSTPVSVFGGYDSYIVQRPNDPNYYMFYVNGNYIEVAACATIAGTYTKTTDVNDWAGWRANAVPAIGGWGIEGPCVIWLGGTSWRVYFQRTIGASYWSESNDNWKTWTAPVLCTDNSTAVQIGHGTIMRYGWTCTSPIASDIDGDCQVNFSDFVRMADAWAGNPPSVDLNNDGKLNFKDLAQFAIDWLSCGRSPSGECWQ